MRTRRMIAPLITAALIAAGSPALAAPPGPPRLPEGLQAVRTRQSLLGNHAFFQQTYRGLPVFGGYYTTHTAADGTVTVTDGRRAVTGLASTAAGLGADRARALMAGPPTSRRAAPRGAPPWSRSSRPAVPGRTRSPGRSPAAGGRPRPARRRTPR
jgi:hypothetical protein